MPNTMTLISAQTLGSSVSSVTFSSIPSTYTDLKLVMSVRGTQAQVYTGGKIEFNGVTTGYSLRQLYGSGSAAFSGTTSAIPFDATGSTATANTFNNCEIYIPNYLSSNNKSLSLDLVTENNATEAYTELYAGLWSNSAAITSILITANSTFNWVANSTFYLYGIVSS